MEILLAILGGSFLSAIINQIGELVRARQKRKYEGESTENKDITALKEAVKLMILDRVRYLGQRYIAEGEVDFDDRRILNEMHKVYHNGLNGNGDLDTIMRDLNNLPLKRPVSPAH